MHSVIGYRLSGILYVKGEKCLSSFCYYSRENGTFPHVFLGPYTLSFLRLLRTVPPGIGLCAHAPPLRNTNRELWTRLRLQFLLFLCGHFRVDLAVVCEIRPGIPSGATRSFCWCNFAAFVHTTGQEADKHYLRAGTDYGVTANIIIASRLIGPPVYQFDRLPH